MKIFVLLLAMIASAIVSPAAILVFNVPLNGANEVNSSGVPNQGDPDGSGTAVVTIDTVLQTISWNISVANIVLPPSGAHIHSGVAGVNGPVVIDFSAQLIGSGLVDPDVVAAANAPWAFYVNIHNSVYPAGAIRGQLGPVPEPGTWLMLAGGLAGIGALRLRRVRK